MIKDQSISISENVSTNIYKDISEIEVVSMTEAEYARYLASKGVTILTHQGRHWRQTQVGFYEPVHWLARLSPAEATPPATLCWGLRAALKKEDARFANGSLPVHLLTDVQNYDMKCLSSNRRNHLRRCYKRTEIISPTDDSLFQAQGYEVFLSASKRTAYEKMISKDEYLETLPPFDDRRHIVLAGLVNGKLGAYITGYAVDGTAYIDEVRIATEAFSSYAGIGLVYEFVQRCRRSEQIREIVYGLHSREDKALCVFKKGMGFPAQQVPTRVKIAAIARSLIQWRYPHKYYRLTGQT